MKRLREVKNGELYYNGYNLAKLAKEYGTPLKITFLDVISEHIESLWWGTGRPGVQSMGSQKAGHD